MKAIYLHAAGAIALSFAIAACVPQAEPPAPTPPPVVQAPAPTPTPTPTPVPVVQEPVYENYLDAPQTAGDWTHGRIAGNSVALFGTNSRLPIFGIRCDRAARAISIGRASPAQSPRSLTIQTETTSRSFAANPTDGFPVDMVGVRLPATDPLLDAMAITKGRFAVGVEGERTLYIPAWVEVSRVIEDCR